MIGDNMTFSRKIFLYSVILFLVLFSGGGIVLIEKINSDNLQIAIETAMYKHLNTKSIIDLNNDNPLDIDINNSDSLKNWIGVIINGYAMNDIGGYYIEVYSNNNEEIISNLNAKITEERKEIINSKKNEKSFIIRDVNNNKYVFVSSNITLKNKELKLITSNSIQEVYDQRIHNYEFFIMIDFIVFIVLAIGMSIISKNITDPLVKLSNVSKDIAQGDYSKRVQQTNSTSEICILEKNFNVMIDIIEENIEELKLLNESKQRFIDSLNHEIKTPITSIIGYSDLLLKSKVNEEMKIKALSYINSEGKRLESLNSTLLKLILVRESKAEMLKTSINEIALNVIDTMNYKLEQKNISIEINLEKALLKVDKQLIIVLLSNLIDNGIKSSYENGKIHISGKKYRESYILEIEDKGIGIPKEDLNKILEPFYMVDKARTRKNNGIGLGLTICSEICKIHNISINIQSQLNIGTKVVLIFNKECIPDEK